MFTGEYRHSVDDKGRLAVPSQFRAQLDAGLVVSRWLDACLAIHTQDGWDALAAKVAPLPITDANARRFSRFIFAGAVGDEPRRPGPGPRPGLPPGDGRPRRPRPSSSASRDHAEIWAPDTWATYRRSLEDPAALAQAIEGLGI